MSSFHAGNGLRIVSSVIAGLDPAIHPLRKKYVFRSRWTRGSSPRVTRGCPRMTTEIRDCLPPVRDTRKPEVVLPAGSIDTHVHVFERRYRLSPGRGYNPPESKLDDLKRLHSILGIDRVVFTQPSVYGTDNSAILDGMAALNAETPKRARCVVAISMEVSEQELARFDTLGVRGVRLNTDNKGGMPIALGNISELASRIAPFGWHLEFLFPGKEILDLMPVFGALKVPISIGHFAYQLAAAGVAAPGFKALVELIRRGNTWVKISGANRVSASDLPPYDDVKPMAQALVEAAPERIMWGTDWPHPNKYVVNPNDGDLVDAFGDWITDHALRHKIMVETPAKFYRF
jgi:predicted TIM-barrel fold metal-dependent hydrolase